MTSEFGTPYYTRIDAAATPEQKNLLKTRSRHSHRTCRRTDHGKTHTRSGKRRPEQEVAEASAD